MQQQQVLRIVCAQTHLTQYHYQSYAVLKQHLLERIRVGLRAHSPAAEQTRARQTTLVILPECTGTWLYLMCVPMPAFLRDYFFRDRPTKGNRHLLFIIYALITHLRPFSRQIYRNYRSAKTWSSLLRQCWFGLFAEQTLTIYERLFGELASETNCTIVAGSIFAHDDRQAGKLYNMSYVFEPQGGSVCLQAGKRYPVADESDFIDCYQRPPAIYSIPNTDVDLGVLLCADSWMPQVYDEYHRLALHGSRRFLFVIVALNTGDWHMPWPGYDANVDIPSDVDAQHLTSYSLPEAWFRYAVKRGFDELAKRDDLRGYGVVCCQGVLNLMDDIRAEGESVILLKRSQHDAHVVHEAQTCTAEKILTCEF